MSEYTSGKTIVKNREIKSEERNLAGDFLAEKGYERQAKPREVNGGRDRLPQNYTQKNKARLNNSLVSAPTNERVNDERARAKAKAMKKKRNEAQVKVAGMRKEKPATPFPAFTIFCLIALTIVSLYVIHLYIELDEIDTKITDGENMIAELKKKETDLQAVWESKYDLEEVERIAREKYGMVDEDQIPKEYITPNTEDSIEIMETEPKDETPGALLSGFAGVVSDLLSYIN
ncbi:MAG: hypothetical protein E7613_07605 [Ruminococcaceae bacterium]|nr:hypothetical protein [Oscillospiraceae bacterium]